MRTDPRLLETLRRLARAALPDTAPISLSPEGAAVERIEELDSEVERLSAEVSSKSEQLGRLYRVCNERDVLRGNVARMRATMLAAVEAIERGSTTAPVLEILKAIALTDNSDSGPPDKCPPPNAASLSNPGADVSGVSATAPGSSLEAT